MGKFFMKRKDYDLLVEEMQDLQEKHNNLKDFYELSLNENRKLARKYNDLKQETDFLIFSKRRVLNQAKNDNEAKNKHIDSLIKENTELHKKIANFKIDTYNSIQANMKNTKKLRIRNKQNKKLKNNIVQHLVNIALDK